MGPGSELDEAGLAMDIRQHSQGLLRFWQCEREVST